MQLYLLRHAQSESNARWAANPGESFHYPDPGITPLGREQALAAAEALAYSADTEVTHHRDPGNRIGFHITHIYSSLMLRAVQTADIIANRLDLPIYGRTDLHEWGGIYEWDVDADERRGLPGRSQAFFEENFPRVILPDDFKEHGWWDRPHEPKSDVHARAVQVFTALCEKHGDTSDRVLVVTHGGFLNFFLSQLVGLTSEQAQANQAAKTWFAINNTSLTRVDVEKRGEGVSDAVVLVYQNRIEHLPARLIT